LLIVILLHESLHKTTSTHSPTPDVLRIVFRSNLPDGQKEIFNIVITAQFDCSICTPDANGVVLRIVIRPCSNYVFLIVHDLFGNSRLHYTFTGSTRRSRW
jgi:hypothetical protein